MKKNDILTPIGLVLAIGFIFFAIAQGKGGVGMFIDIPSFLITVRRFICSSINNF